MITHTKYRSIHIPKNSSSSVTHVKKVRRKGHTKSSEVSVSNIATVPQHPNQSLKSTVHQLVEPPQTKTKAVDTKKNDRRCQPQSKIFLLNCSPKIDKNSVDKLSIQIDSTDEPKQKLNRTRKSVRENRAGRQRKRVCLLLLPLACLLVGAAIAAMLIALIKVPTTISTSSTTITTATKTTVTTTTVTTETSSTSTSSTSTTSTSTTSKTTTTTTTSTTTSTTSTTSTSTTSKTTTTTTTSTTTSTTTTLTTSTTTTSTTSTSTTSKTTTTTTTSTTTSTTSTLTTSTTTTSTTSTTSSSTTSKTTTSTTTLTTTSTTSTSTTSKTTTTTTTSTTTSTTTTKTTSTSTTSKTTTTTATTATSVTTTSATTTTSIVCVSPYVRTPSQTCVNILIDFYNCGAVGYVCPASYRSCSAGVCSTAPSIQLANALSIWSSATNGGVDDSMYNVTLPFNITLYNKTTNRITTTTNGVLCLGGCNITYTETALPTNTFPGATVLPYWDDLYVYPSTSQGIYYGTEGNAPNRTLVFEYYMSHYGQSTQYYHFQVVFFEASPGIVEFKYFDASDGGITCTVGVQSSGTGPFMQYTFDRANSVQSNMTLSFDTNLGAYTNSTLG